MLKGRFESILAPFKESNSQPLLPDGKFDEGATAYDIVIQTCMIEFLSTLVYTLIGISSMPSDNALTISAAHGLALIVLHGSFGQISGCHLNPAVTVGVMLAGSINPILAVAYFFSQVLGGIIGAALCRVMLSYPSDSNTGESQYEIVNGGVTFPGMGVRPGSAILCEVLLTYILVTTVLMTSLEPKSKTPMAPLAVGFVVMVNVICGIQVSGGSMNPARSFGPAVVASNVKYGIWDVQYIYWVGPFAGSALAALLYRLFLCAEEKRLFRGGMRKLSTKPDEPTYEDPYFEEEGEYPEGEGDEEDYGDYDEED